MRCLVGKSMWVPVLALNKLIFLQPDGQKVNFDNTAGDNQTFSYTELSGIILGFFKSSKARALYALLQKIYVQLVFVSSAHAHRFEVL